MFLNPTCRRLSLVAGVALIAAWVFVLATPVPATITKQKPPVVPPAIQVPAGTKLFLVVHATGTQNYTCNGSGAWGPAVPAANLYNKHGKQVGTHFAGPTWKYKDGSSVLGAKVAGVTATPGAIDWLLIKEVSTTTGADGGDTLTDVTYIQRLNTSGGLAPAGACVAATTASTAYSADYYFYRAATDDDDDDRDN